MSEKNNLPTKRPTKDLAALHDVGTGSRRILDIAVSNLTPEELGALRVKTLEEKLRLEVDAQERLIDYQFGKQAAQDHVDAFNMLEKGGRLTSQKIESDIKTGAGNMRIESKSGVTCFVATAAYGDPYHEDVVFLRSYRDDILTKHVFGRFLISLYWRVGPVLARPVERNPVLQSFVRKKLLILVSFLRKRAEL